MFVAGCCWQAVTMRQIRTGLASQRLKYIGTGSSGACSGSHRTALFIRFMPSSSRSCVRPANSQNETKTDIIGQTMKAREIWLKLPKAPVLMLLGASLASGGSPRRRPGTTIFTLETSRALMIAFDMLAPNRLLGKE